MPRMAITSGEERPLIRSATSASEQKDKTRDAFSAKKAENAQTTFEGASDFDVKDAPDDRDASRVVGR